ncbi:MAG: hypothetical protein ACRCVN_03645 [Spirochaetia bacterium]
MKRQPYWSIKKVIALVLNVISMCGITFIILNFVGLPILRLSPSIPAVETGILLGCLIAAIFIHFKIYQNVLYPLFLEEGIE